MSLFSSILKSFAPKRRKKRKRRSGAVRAGGGFMPSDGGPGTRVVVASLFGSGGKEISDKIARMIGGESVVQTLRLQQVLKQNLRLGLLERLLAANEEGNGILKDERGDILIWGEMEDMGTVARMRFMSAGGSAEGQAGAFGLADTLDLPVPLPDALSDIVTATAIAAVLPATQGSRKSLAERLGKLLGGAEKALDAIPDDTPAENRATVHGALGNAFATAFRFGDKKALAGALKQYEAADALIDAETAPLAWALVQSHWGTLLEADARQRKDPAALEAAIARYEAVSEGLARDAHAYDWAMAHVRRAMALYKLASLAPEKTSTYLKAAVSAFEEALTVYDRSVMPWRWAEVMNHYGVAQMALGGYGAGNAMLQQAIITFRKALEVRKRETAPELWAQTANNLGAACFALAKRTEEEHLLVEAANSFRGAAEIFLRLPGNKKRAQVIAKNRERVQQMLAKASA